MQSTAPPETKRAPSRPVAPPPARSEGSSDWVMFLLPVALLLCLIATILVSRP